MGSLSRQRPRVRVPSSPPLFSGACNNVQLSFILHLGQCLVSSWYPSQKLALRHRFSACWLAHGSTLIRLFACCKSSPGLLHILDVLSEERIWLMSLS